MQIQDFLSIYQEKSDEELLQLSAAADELTSEARLALESELSRRQISIAADSAACEGDPSPIGRAGASQRLQEGEWQGVGSFVEETLGTYHQHFWLFFRITLPAVVISTAGFMTRRDVVWEITRHLPRGAVILAYRAEILEVWLTNLSVFLVSWMAFSFSFGAICIAVEESTSGFMTSAWHSLLSVRERFGPFLRLSLLLFILVGVGESASIALATAVPVALSQLHVHLSRQLSTCFFYPVAGLALLLLSRLALSVPAVVLDDYAVWQSLFRSVELTQKKWFTLAALLAKSLIGSYVAGRAPFWLVSFVRVSTPLPSWFPWVLTVASVIGVTVVEPLMFVGFAVLYLKMTAPDAAPRGVLESQMA